MSKKGKKILNKKGFSLIEILVSLAIFSLIVAGVVVFGVRTIEAHTKAQAMQNSIENARFAIESLNKKIRTSSNISDGDADDFTKEGEVFIIDNLDGSKHCYKFVDGDGDGYGELEVGIVDGTSSATDCSDADFSGKFSSLVGAGKVMVVMSESNFYVKPTDEASGARGFVRTSITIQYDDPSVPPAERDTIVIQSGVSLRDY